MKSLKRKFSLSIAASFVALLFITDLDLSAKSFDVQQEVSNHTEQSIKEKFIEYLPSYTDKVYNASPHFYEILPSLQPPYNPGKLKSSYIEDGLRATNFVRYLAGIPDDITLAWENEFQQQAGALVNAFHNKLEHTPSRIESMPDDLFDIGYAATSTSNIAFGYGNLYHAVILGYMSDAGYSNFLPLGHRRWILNPQMKKTMFGMVPNINPHSGAYSTMHVFNHDRNIDDVQYQYIAWPSAGVFPIEAMSPLDPWHISLNEQQYDLSKLEEATVTVTRKKDNQSWHFSGTQLDYDGDWYTVNKQGYGIHNAIIFRPGGIVQFEEGDQFDVKVESLYLHNGTQASISYTVTMFDMLYSFPKHLDGQLYAAVGQTVSLPQAESLQPVTMQVDNLDIAAIDKGRLIKALKAGSTAIEVDPYMYNEQHSFNLTVLENGTNVNMSGWAQNGIIEALNLGIRDGDILHSNLKEPITRIEFVNYMTAMIERILDIDIEQEKIGESPFSDIHQNHFNVIWAAEQNLISGIGGGLFAPYDYITREQAASLLLKVYKYLGGEEASGLRDAYADTNSISEWAKISVYRVSSLKLMGDIGQNKFNPKGQYTEEQAIITLLRTYHMLHN